jgi:hypothetical protein
MSEMITHVSDTTFEKDVLVECRVGNVLDHVVHRMSSFHLGSGTSRGTAIAAGDEFTALMQPVHRRRWGPVC